MGVTTSLVQRWWSRTTAAVTLVAAIAVVLAITGILGKGAPWDRSAPAAAPVGPSSSPPPAQTVVPEAAAAPAAALPVPVSAVRRAPLADRYPGALQDAPDGTLGAYQRAAAIIDVAADCHLDWMTLAAIARIESNHGRGASGSHEVDEDGVVTPALVGRPLNGRGGRGEVDDTDGGKVDANKRWDAPVGPFALLPSVWASVAVDADGDDVRNPQDVDDSALAAAVLLCAGGRDLADAATLRKALRSYHRTPGFAATVLALTAVYAEEMESVPVFLPAPGILPIPDDLVDLCDCARKTKDKDKGELHALPAADTSGGGEPHGGGGATPPSDDPGTPGPGAGPSDSGDPVAPPADEGDPVAPADPPSDPVDPPPSTEPEPTPEPVDPPAETFPEPAAERTAEPVGEPAPEPKVEATTDEPPAAAGADEPAP